MGDIKRVQMTYWYSCDQRTTVMLATLLIFLGGQPTRHETPLSLSLPNSFTLHDTSPFDFSNFIGQPSHPAPHTIPCLLNPINFNQKSPISGAKHVTNLKYSHSIDTRYWLACWSGAVKAALRRKQSPTLKRQSNDGRKRGHKGRTIGVKRI